MYYGISLDYFLFRAHISIFTKENPVSRGYFDFVGHNDIYQSLEKNWHVELATSTFFWFDLVVNPPEGMNYQRIASDYLKELRAEVEKSTDKRFVYFISSRKRVRFSAVHQPRYSLLKNKLFVYVEIGRERLLRRLTLTWPKDVERPQLPAVSADGRFLLVGTEHDSKPLGVSIHEFLLNHGFQLGIATEVHYVGSTDDPATRPLNRIHRGYGDVVYSVSPDDNDIFVFYNIFKVLSIAVGANSPINFVVGNSIIDEVKKKEEGEVLEHCLINYFGAKSQEANKKAEYTRLKNGLSGLWARHKIRNIAFHIEMNEPGEIFRFFSRKVAATEKHNFSCSIEKGEVVIGEPIDALSYFQD